MWSLRNSLILMLSLAVTLPAAQLILPAPALERDGIVPVVYRMNTPAMGKATLHLRWTDQHNRVVEDRQTAFVLSDELEFTFSIDLRRARAMKNRLVARFALDGVDAKGEPDRRNEEVALDFLAKPPDPQWRDYRIIMWQQYPARVFPTLKQVGINAGQYVGRNPAPADFLIENDLQWYVENIATDFYAEYHRYRRDRRGNWPFYEAKDLYKRDPNSKEPFKRHPSLSDPSWLKKIHDRLVDVTKAHSPYRPLFYDLGDESGIADLSAYWEFDFSDHSLAEMRVWLKERYGSLEALNRQWGSAFKKWELVTPETTEEAMRRTDGNFSSWADHKEWMDVSFARALRMGVDAVNSVDRAAYVGIAGAQMPGWGGYDYWRLTRALTFFEPYNIGNNIEMLRSFSPQTPVVTTSFARGPWEQHRVWYELLHGNRGLILWDDKFEFANRETGAVGPRGEETKPYYQELRNGLGALLINSQRLADPVAIHYSQASFRTDWMLAQQPKGKKWVERNASTERLDSDFLPLRESYCRLLEDIGLQYRFVAYEQVEQGELLRGGYRVLILPGSISLSTAEAAGIREFVSQGGTLITNAVPGTYDEHSRRLGESRLADLFREGANTGRGRVVLLKQDILNYHQHRLLGKEEPVRDMAAKLLADAGVTATVMVRDGQGRAVTGVETHRFLNGRVEILGFLTNPQLRVNELGPPEFKSNERFEKPRSLRVRLAAPRHVVDLRTGKPLGQVQEWSLTLDPYQPAVYAVSADAPPAFEVAAPARVARGANAVAGLRAKALADTQVYHVDVLGPSGQVLDVYSGNVLAQGGVAAHLIPIAMNDPPGDWTLRVTDRLTGKTSTQVLRVE